MCRSVETVSTMSEPNTEPALELRFSDEWLQAAELDASAWGIDEPHNELEGGEPTHCDYGVPLGEDADADDVPTRAWDLGGLSLRRVAAAAAFVPLMIAEPALAAPPTSAVVSGPSEPPASTEPAVWEALVQRSVVLTLADGLVFRGTVLSVTNGVLVCARELDGLLVFVDPAQISSVEVEGLPGTTPKQPANGRGMIITGAIATAIGGLTAIGAVLVGVACHESYADGYLCPYYTVPIGAVSAVSLAVGIPVLAVGLHKRKKAREAAPTLSAVVAPNRTGGMVGVGVRF
jgi:hypothetical protein